MPKHFPKILFITHESTLSGAPILLLNLLKLLKDNHVHFSCVIKRGGPLDKDFAALAKTTVLKPESYQLNKNFLGKVVDYFFYKIRLYKVKAAARSCDVIFSNTITNGRLLLQLKSLRKPILVYVHELETVIQFYKQDSDLTVQLADVFLSPSDAVSHNLAFTHSIANVLPLNYFFSRIADNFSLAKEEMKAIFLKKYKIPADRFYVVGMGAANLRKGIDLFVECCKIVSEQVNDVHFIWIGDFMEQNVKEQIEKEIIKNDLKDNLTITGFICPDPLNLLPFDLLALTSREDPYPLVVLEAALLQIPTIAFKGTGGMENFLSNNCGFIVDLSVNEMADKIIQLKSNRYELKQNGINAYNKVIEQNTNQDLILAQLQAAFQAVWNKST
ncbi:MAG: hypothetical protein C4329_06695 [Chitinophagaceae bacterium]